MSYLALKRNKYVISLLSLIIVVALFCIFVLQDDDDKGTSSTASSGHQVGQFPEGDDDRAETPSQNKNKYDYGVVQPISRDKETPQNKSARDALEDKSGKLAHRITPWVKLPKFDAAKWESDEKYRNAYLTEHVPGRVYQTAQPGEGPVLKPKGGTHFNLHQGERVTLKAKAPAGTPVSFLAFDLAKFTASQSTCVTVVADNNGIASAEVEAISGSINNCEILAGGPMTTGQIRYALNVSLPPEAEAKSGKN